MGGGARQVRLLTWWTPSPGVLVNRSHACRLRHQRTMKDPRGRWGQQTTRLASPPASSRPGEKLAGIGASGGDWAGGLHSEPMGTQGITLSSK